MRKHVTCGGELKFSHTKQTRLKHSNKTIRKQMYECQRCGQLINVVDLPSYEQYVLMGQIRINKKEYHAIKKQYEKVKQ